MEKTEHSKKNSHVVKWLNNNRKELNLAEIGRKSGMTIPHHIYEVLDGKRKFTKKQLPEIINNIKKHGYIPTN